MTLSDWGDPAFVQYVYVCVHTDTSMLICHLFLSDTICLCYILSAKTTLFTLKISLAQQHF